jgi:hypothetical protein
MFTIRHMTPTGSEALHEAQSVSFTPIEPAPLGQPALTAQHQLGSLWLTPPDPNAPLVELRDGQVYVMNETGSTVAKYDLGGWKYPSSILGPDDPGASLVGSRLPKREKPEFFDKRYDNVVD